jgi:hypothetical protein
MALVRLIEGLGARWERTMGRWADERRNYTWPLIGLGLGSLLLLLESAAVHSWQQDSGSVFVDVAARLFQVGMLLVLSGFAAVAALALRQRCRTLASRRPTH